MNALQTASTPPISRKLSLRATRALRRFVLILGLSFFMLWTLLPQFLEARQERGLGRLQRGGGNKSALPDGGQQLLESGSVHTLATTHDVTPLSARLEYSWQQYITGVGHG